MKFQKQLQLKDGTVVRFDSGFDYLGDRFRLITRASYTASPWCTYIGYSVKHPCDINSPRVGRSWAFRRAIAHLPWYTWLKLRLWLWWTEVTA